MSPARALGDAFADMPLVLKGITSFFLVFGAGSVLLALAPGVEHRVAGEAFSRAVLWSSGLGPFAVLFGGWLAACALGLLRRAAWARWGVALSYLAFVPLEAFVADAPRVGLQCALAVVWALGVGAYLFRTRGAASYFATRRSAPLGVSKTIT